MVFAASWVVSKTPRSRRRLPSLSTFIRSFSSSLPASHLMPARWIFDLAWSQWSLSLPSLAIPCCCHRAAAAAESVRVVIWNKFILYSAVQVKRYEYVAGNNSDNDNNQSGRNNLSPDGGGEKMWMDDWTNERDVDFGFTIINLFPIRISQSGLFLCVKRSHRTLESKAESLERKLCHK